MKLDAELDPDPPNTNNVCASGFRSRSIWLEPETSLWPDSGSTLNICLIIHANYMELNLI